MVFHEHVTRDGGTALVWHGMPREPIAWRLMRAAIWLGLAAATAAFWILVAVAAISVLA